MKIKIDPKNITTLKGVENYKKWKQEVEMLLFSQGLAYLMDPAPEPTTPQPPQQEQDGGSSSSGGTSVNISINKGKGKAAEEEDGVVTLDRWTSESAQVVTGLYFTVAPIYQSLIYNLTPKTLPKLFGVLDGMFVAKDTMVLVAKRSELDNFKLVVDNKFLDHLMKVDNMLINYKELDGSISNTDQTYLLIKALPVAYKEKLEPLYQAKVHQMIMMPSRQN